MTAASDDVSCAANQFSESIKACGIVEREHTNDVFDGGIFAPYPIEFRSFNQVSIMFS